MATDDALFQEGRIFRAGITDARHLLDSHLSHDRSPSALHFMLHARASDYSVTCPNIWGRGLASISTYPLLGAYYPSIYCYKRMC